MPTDVESRSKGVFEEWVASIQQSCCLDRIIESLKMSICKS